MRNSSRSKFGSTTLRTTLRVGCLTLAVLFAAFVLSVRKTPIGIGVRVPVVFAQSLGLSCPGSTLPLPSLTLRANNGQLFNWGCQDTNGTLYIAGNAYIGADPTGVSDSSTAIQNAINIVCNGLTSNPPGGVCSGQGQTIGGIVYFPSGTFKTTIPILSWANIRLIGKGNQSTIIAKSTNTVGTYGTITAGTGVGRTPTSCGGNPCTDNFNVDAVIEIPYQSSGSTAYAYRWGIEHIGIYFQGTPNGGKYGIFAPRNSQSTIEDVYIAMGCINGNPSGCGGVQGHGFWTEDSWLMSYKRVVVDSSTFGMTYVNDGSNVGTGTSSVFENCWMVNIGFAGFDIFGLAYSTFIANAVDHFNVAVNDLPNLNFSYAAYSFNTVAGISIDGGGAEDVHGPVFSSQASSITIAGGFKTFALVGFTSISGAACVMCIDSSQITFIGTQFSTISSPGNFLNEVLQNGSTQIDENSVLPTGGNTFIGYGGSSVKYDVNFSGISIAIANAATSININKNGDFTTGRLLTNSNCSVNSASPAACGSAPSGVFAVPTTTTTYTVNTTAVTASSRIILEDITDNTGIPSSPTCTALASFGVPQISSRVAGTSFTITLPSTAGTTCFNYWIVN